MAEKRLIKYVCDCCKKEFIVEDNDNSESPLRLIQMPSKKYDCEGRHYTRGMSKVELCEECCAEYWEYSQAKYDVSEFYNVTVEKKG